MSTRDRSARDKAYSLVRSQILSLQLPPSARIDENDVARESGVSRTPVREALHQLAAEDLVVIGPRGGYTVMDLNVRRYRELMEAQQIIVRAVTHLLVARASEADLERMEQAVRAVEEAEQAGEPYEIAESNAQLHILEATLAGNSYLAEMAAKVNTNLQRLSFISFGGQNNTDELPAHYERVNSDHRGYLAALRDRDVETAERIAVEHVDLFHDRMMRYLRSHEFSSIDFSGVVRRGEGDG